MPGSVDTLALEESAMSMRSSLAHCRPSNTSGLNSLDRMDTARLNNGAILFSLVSTGSLDSIARPGEAVKCRGQYHSDPKPRVMQTETRPEIGPRETR